MGKNLKFPAIFYSSIFEFKYQDQMLLEIAFTIFYDLEALFKIFCLSFRGYISR